MTEQSETPFRVYIDQAPPGTGTDLVCVGSADDVSLGDLLLDLHKRNVRPDGIMYRPVDGEPGEWLLNPWAKGA